LETSSTGGTDIKDVASSLQNLWERARRVSDLVVQMRKENEELRQSLLHHEESERTLSETVQRKEQELERVQAELHKLQENGSSFLKHDEKAALTEKIKDLISKIESRL
jgi:uncharacterized protein YoxC